MMVIVKPNLKLKKIGKPRNQAVITDLKPRESVDEFKELMEKEVDISQKVEVRSLDNRPFKLQMQFVLYWKCFMQKHKNEEEKHG